MKGTRDTEDEVLGEAGDERRRGLVCLLCACVKVPEDREVRISRIRLGLRSV